MIYILFVVCIASVSLNIYTYFDKKKASSPTNTTPLLPQTDDVDVHVTKEPELPSGWWRDESQFQLERRAIFSKTWICVSHRSRFGKPGDYVTFEVAGFPFFLILGKDSVVRAFHNVCRHRAYSVTKKAAGSSLVLGCRYHGWSYDTRGRLTKAPEFDKVPGFDKAQNSLFEIHARVDAHGFVYVNLDASEEAGDGELWEVTKVGKPTEINHDSCWLHCWEFKGKFNWKGNTDDASPTFGGLPTSRFFRALESCGYSMTGQLRFFPLATVYTKNGSPFWYKITFSPDSPTQTTVWCDVYSTKYTNAFRFEGAVKDGLEKEMKSKIHALEEQYAELEASNTFQEESGTFWIQATITTMVKEHLKKERAAGEQIHPAAVQQCRSSSFAQAEKRKWSLRDPLGTLLIP
ncbi:ISP domain-containing protein [Rhizodiscina lignyota]|uniref:ISP domain-containing protein n=1 Tax=Rhizodiscina lignyota TaxID=1504668 RepID=A0A9P4MEF7_9PEZI|nr:ISP domain-containing protein [Rhizodiscina lignyota]